MESYNSGLLTKKLYDSEFEFFSLKTLRDILGIIKEGTFYSAVKRLIEKGILRKLEKNKYILSSAKISDLRLANLLYIPSYISFETALNMAGVVSQFPYEITSATVKKSLTKKIDSKVFTYTHLQKSLIWGYYKDDHLIAEPEKALLDLAYLAAKGFKKINLDEYDLSELNKKKVKDYLIRYPVNRQFLSIKKELISKLKL